MAMNKASRVPGVPTLPKGETIGVYDTYLEAQRAVDHLSDQEFEVQYVTIVGSDLRMVERVTGRLTYSRVALAGLASGAWFGLVVGLLLTLVSSAEVPPILPAVAIGAAAGIIFSVISYSLTGGKRDFTSSSQIVATGYALLCAPEQSHRARNLLTQQGGPGVGRAGGAARNAVQPAMAQPATTHTTPLSGASPVGSQPDRPQPEQPHPSEPQPGTPPQAPPSHQPTPHGDPTGPGPVPTSPDPRPDR